MISIAELSLFCNRDFNDIVLAGIQGKYGAQFVIWD